MVVDIRVVRVVRDSFFEAVEGLLRISLFHVDACHLDQALGERRDERDRCKQILFGVVDITSQEPAHQIRNTALRRKRETDLKVPRKLRASALPTSHETPCSSASDTRVSE